VARLIAAGSTNRQIAEELVIAEPTAERHVAKLGVHSRAQVAGLIAAAASDREAAAKDQR
jgi:DNA-binding NarL/FixJ family response regulator